MTRLTRREQKAKTRTCLLESAARVFSRHGLSGASVEQVADAAGYTKGAFYANFKSKEELFLAMLDERFAERIQALDEVLASDAPLADQARAGGQELLAYVAGDREWERLFFEFAAHAARDDDFREELVARYRTLIDHLAEGLRRRADEVGFEPPGPVGQFALMVFAAANGMALQQLLDPDSVAEDLFPAMMELLTLGATVKAERAAEAAVPPRRTRA